MRTALRVVVVAWLAGLGAAGAPRLEDRPAAGRPAVVGEWTQDNGGERHEFTAGGVLLVGDPPAAPLRGQRRDEPGGIRPHSPGQAGGDVAGDPQGRG